jgi:hypothetical protein
LISFQLLFDQSRGGHQQVTLMRRALLFVFLSLAFIQVEGT